MKKVLVFGSNGLLGQNLVRRFKDNYTVFGASRSAENKYPAYCQNYLQVNMINRSEMADAIEKVKPNIIINAAAYTDVDKAEMEKELCWNTNVRAVENIIDSSEAIQPILVHISSDYVFDGSDGEYHEKDPVSPLGYYARSKVASENIVTSCELEYIIARTQVLYGYASQVRHNFATWVISRLSANKSIKVVIDQVGNPTYVEDLGESIFRLLERKEYGLFHISGCEAVSRYKFAQKIAEIFNLDEGLIERVVTADLEQASPRPKNSSFIIDKLVNRIDWEPGDIVSGLRRLKNRLNEKNG